ncbi:hypothetical protein ACGF0D_43000 [Kitasatospora sp. NPDC048298]|uniref:hypothetical protein n=1 Tax=Kitasatospora sp. NPDC048298 TaxID=3364049 RepID=UPI00371EFA0D
MPKTNLLLPAEPDILGDLYALEEPLLLQLRPAPDEDGEPWSPLPDTLDGEVLYEAYHRVLDALSVGTADVVYGRADLVPGVPMLVGADGRELVQLLDVQVEGQDLIRLSWLRDELARADDDLAVLLDDLAEDRHAPWWTGTTWAGGTAGGAVAAWARRALAPVLHRGVTREEASDKAELLAIVRAGAGRERIELTEAQEEVYGRYMVALIRATAAGRTSADLTAFATGLR